MAKSGRYPAQTITNNVYADYIALLANTPTLAESLLPSLEQTSVGVGSQNEYMCFSQRDDISPLNGGSLKQVDKFSYLESSVPSTENDINTRLAKAWAAIDRQSILWTSALSDEIKQYFFQAVVVSILLYGCTA